MPHECPKMGISEAPSLNINDAARIAHQNIVPKEKVKMTALEKENSRAGAPANSNSKAQIPEHIHDTNAKTFYKLGQFLGKV